MFPAQFKGKRRGMERETETSDRQARAPAARERLGPCRAAVFLHDLKAVGAARSRPLARSLAQAKTHKFDEKKKFDELGFDELEFDVVKVRRKTSSMKCL
jgi:hypothetical protein